MSRLKIDQKVCLVAAREWAENDISIVQFDDVVNGFCICFSAENLRSRLEGKTGRKLSHLVVDFFNLQAEVNGKIFRQLSASQLTSLKICWLEQGSSSSDGNIVCHRKYLNVCRLRGCSANIREASEKNMRNFRDCDGL